MKTTKMLTILVLALAVVFWQAEASKAEPMGTAWTYQGRLLDANGPPDGLYDFQFKLFDDSNTVTGNQVGSTVDINSLDVIDGYFTAELDFGSDVFDGDARWLEIGVRPGGSIRNHTTINPRQKVTPTPYALQTRGIFVDDNGNVSIGGTDPWYALDVYKAVSDSWIAGFHNLGTGDMDGGVIVRAFGGDPLLVQSATANVLNVKQNGNVGIGTNVPDKKLTVAEGDFAVYPGQGSEPSIITDAFNVKLGDPDGARNQVFLEVDDLTEKFVFNNGNVGIGTSSPDKFLTLEKQGQAGSAPQIKIKGYYDGSGGGSYLVMGKSRGSIVGDNQATANGDTLGLIDTFGINYLGNEATATRIMFKQDGLSFSPYIPGRIEFYTSDGGSGAAERMRIDNDGKVGIGTTNPEVDLHVQGDARVSDDLWVQDSLTVSGPRIGTFPRPAYDSGWVGISPGSATTLTHNLAGIGYNDVDDYVVDLQFKDIENYGINNVAIGSDGSLDHDHTHDEFPSYHYSYRGAFWTNLTSSTIRVARMAEDAEADGIRVRIWVYK